MATGSVDETLIIWDATKGHVLLSLNSDYGSVYGLAWSPDGKRLATACDSFAWQVWDLETGKTSLSKYDIHTGGVQSVAWSSDGKKLATGNLEGTAKVWNASNGKDLLTTELKDGSDLISSVAWSPDAKRLATGSWGGLPTYGTAQPATISSV